MNQGKTVLSQVLSLLNRYEFNKCVDRYHGNYKVKHFTCWEQFVAMSFAQLTYRESLRDIEACLAAVQSKLYHSGVKNVIKRSTLADANHSRNWKIYADFAQVLIVEARELYKGDNKFSKELESMVYAIDSSTIDLCLNLFPWAKFKQEKGAIKLHVQLDLNGAIPSFIQITDGSVHDVNFLDFLVYEAGAFYIMDRGYLDYSRLKRIDASSAFFVTRAKRNMAFKRLYSRPVESETGLRCDQTIRLKGIKSQKDFPDKLRRVKFYDSETDKTLVFLTNNFNVAAITIAQLYRERWKIELFFRWIKQHLKIKTFFGNSTNAVYSQIWIAISTYLLVAIMKKRLNLDHELYKILQVLSVCIFEKTTVSQLFENYIYNLEDEHNPNQLKMF